MRVYELNYWTNLIERVVSVWKKTNPLFLYSSRKCFKERQETRQRLLILLIELRNLILYSFRCPSTMPFATSWNPSRNRNKERRERKPKPFARSPEPSFTLLPVKTISDLVSWYFPVKKGCFTFELTKAASMNESVYFPGILGCFTFSLTKAASILINSIHPGKKGCFCPFSLISGGNIVVSLSPEP